jgi:hypothetical protein
VPLERSADLATKPAAAPEHQHHVGSKFQGSEQHAEKTDVQVHRAATPRASEGGTLIHMPRQGMAEAGSAVVAAGGRDLIRVGKSSEEPSVAGKVCLWAYNSTYTLFALYSLYSYQLQS